MWLLLPYMVPTKIQKHSFEQWKNLLPHHEWVLEFIKWWLSNPIPKLWAPIAQSVECNWTELDPKDELRIELHPIMGQLTLQIEAYLMYMQSISFLYYHMTKTLRHAMTTSVEGFATALSAHKFSLSLRQHWWGVANVLNSSEVPITPS